MRIESNLGKVVVRKRDGGLHRGFSKSDLIGDSVQVIDEKGNSLEYPLEELKAIFFVRDFEGNASYRVVRFYGKEAPNGWLWVQVTFIDGEILEGRIKNNLAVLDPRGVFIWLSDEDANNEVAFVVRSAIRDLKILGLA